MSFDRVIGAYDTGLNFHTVGLTVQCIMTSMPWGSFALAAKIDNYTFAKPLGN